MKVKSMFVFLTSLGIMFSQSTVSGTVKDTDTKETLIGANVFVKGTTVGTSTDVDGFYKLSLKNGKYTLSASYVGYTTKSVILSVLTDTEMNFELKASLLSTEVVVTANRARIRETPIAFTNVSGDDLQKNYVTQDVPDLLSAVPGVFSSSNGLGEGEIFVRGFDAEHIQIMINGVPVNDPESQKTYWSNWSGLSSSAKDIQIQRGVGSSLYGSGSLGGSINIEYGDFSVEREIIVYTAGVSYSRESVSAAQNGVLGFKYTSGLSDDGKWNFLLGFEMKRGNSYVLNTLYEGSSYTAGIEHLMDNHKFTFNFVGAPQSHNQARTSQDIDLIKTLGREYNRNNHKYQENYYFKPQYELHHKWLIDDNTQWNTNIFYTTGRGGGTYLRNDNFDVKTGKVSFKDVTDATDGKYFGRHALYIYGKTDGEVILSGFNPADSTYSYNGKSYHVSKGQNLLSSTYAHSWRNDSHSEHNQMGFNTIFQKKFTELISLTAGGEYRYWHGLHFSDSELFRKSDGAGGIKTLDRVQQRYNYDGFTKNLSGFARVQLKPIDNLTVMIDGQYANYSYKIEDREVDIYDFASERFTGKKYKETQNSNIADSEFERTYSFFTPKFGANYNINAELNFFANYSIAKKEPKVGDWYDRARGPKKEKITEETVNTFEIGAGYNSSIFSANANYYMTDYKDKITSVTTQDGERNTVNAGNAKHSGLELALAYRLTLDDANLILSSNITLSDNYWETMSVDKIFGKKASDVIGKKVPFSPLTMLNFAVDYSKGSWGISLSDRYWEDYYTNYTNTEKLPSFNELNAKIYYNMELKGGVKLQFSIGGNNLLNKDNYAKGTWGRDYGRNDKKVRKYQVYIQQSPLRNFSTTIRVIF